MEDPAVKYRIEVESFFLRGAAKKFVGGNGAQFLERVRSTFNSEIFCDAPAVGFLVFESGSEADDTDAALKDRTAE